MTVITRAELAEALVNQCGICSTHATKTVNEFFGSIGELVASGEKVRVPAMGTFYQHYKSQRNGRNPKTGEPCPIAPRTLLRCKFVRPFRERILNAS